jgi:hypothetical protein
MASEELKPDSMPQRLCSEIQLFDLCSLSTCRFKSGRFCSNPDLLERFEKINDAELRLPQQYQDEELDEDEDSDRDDFDDYDRDDAEEDDWCED